MFSQQSLVILKVTWQGYIKQWWTTGFTLQVLTFAVNFVNNFFLGLNLHQLCWIWLEPKQDGLYGSILPCWSNICTTRVVLSIFWFSLCSQVRDHTFCSRVDFIDTYPCFIRYIPIYCFYYGLVCVSATVATINRRNSIKKPLHSRISLSWRSHTHLNRLIACLSLYTVIIHS